MRPASITTTMICRPKEITIPEQEPFLNCKLNRREHASTLTKVVGQLNGGGVLSICGDWGTGKTTFVKMWEQQLKNEGFHTLYFNVWEHDFISDPLVGIITQFKNNIPSENAKAKFKECSQYCLSILTGIIPKMAKAAVKNYFGEEGADIVEAGVKKASESFDDILDHFEKQSRSIIEFRRCLGDYVHEIGSDKPIVFIVDELDRCNPHFAVKTLERIKHLFNLPGILFVLSIDKNQLCNSIRGYFGSEQFNAEEYLQRFVDFEYQLPQPSIKEYCEYLWGEYDFDQFTEFEKGRREFARESFLRMSEILFSNNGTNLRDIAKQFAHIRVVIQSFKQNELLPPGTVLLLEYLRHKHSNVYKKIQLREYTIAKFVESLEECLPHNALSNTNDSYYGSRDFVSEIAKLVCCYAQEPERCKKNQLLTEGESPKLTFKCKLINEEMLFELIKFHVHNGYRKIGNIRYLIEHIELLKDFSVN